MVALLLAATPAIAQQPQPPAYEPFTVTENDYKTLMSYLNTQPLGVVEPIANWLRQQEAEAVKTKAANLPPPAK
jgi:hypothetical protein